MIDVMNTTSNQALASSIRAHIKADSRIINATAAGLRLVGIGAMIGIGSLGIGLGIGAACYGYAYVYDPRTSIEQMAEAIGSAINNARLTGEVSVAPNSTVGVDSSQASPLRLDANGTKVALDASAASVKLNSAGAAPIKLDTSGAVRLDASGASVKLDANGATLPSKPSDWPAVRAATTEGGDYSGGEPQHKGVTTSFTIFKTVKYGQGTVVTGWEYNNSDQTTPDTQFCYYTRALTGSGTLSIYIGVDRRPIPDADGRGEIDPSVAVKQCIWAS